MKIQEILFVFKDFYSIFTITDFCKKIKKKLSEKKLLSSKILLKKFK
jgi:hypothetical protein